MVLVSCVMLLACAGNAVRERNASAALDDLTITARVKTALLNDQQLDATKIGVHTADGVVTLSGSVSTPAEAARAIELARGTPGVKDVTSTLLSRDEGRTTNPGPRTDQARGPKA